MNDIKIYDINLKGSKPNYPRSTRNLYSHTIDGSLLWFSYSTLIALDGIISTNFWSVTTAKHLTWIDPDKSKRRDDFNEIARDILKSKGLLEERDPLEFVSSISKLFDIMSDDENEEQIRKTNNQRLRFYATQPGIIIPDDWDQLTTKEQKKRLDLVDLVGLGEANKVLDKRD